MARILVIEPHPEVRELLARVVGRLGHEVVPQIEGELLDIDLVLVEPQAWGGVELARKVRDETGAAVLCISVAPPSEETRALEPVSHMVKPFALSELEGAVVAALGSRNRAVA